MSPQNGGYVSSTTEAADFTQNISQCVVGVTIKQNGPHTDSTKQKVSAFKLHLADATTVTIGTIDNTDDSFYSALEMGLLGFKCQYHESPHGNVTPTYSYSAGCIPYTDTCVGKNIDDKTLTDMTIEVTQSTSQNISFKVEGTTCCGTRVFTLSPSSPLSSFMTISTVGIVSTLTLSTSNLAYVGSHPVAL